MSDPLGPPDPSNPWWVPPDYPVFTEASPMPPADAPGSCPHCGAVWLSGRGGHANKGDAAICEHCLNLLIGAEDGGWRMATYDEAEMWGRDGRIVAMRAVWGKPQHG